MPKWHLEFTPEASEDIKKLDKNLRKRIIKKLDWFLKNFDNLIPLSLGGEWQGFFKLRIGNWRIIYKIEWEKNKIIIFVIDKRDKVYKMKKH